MVILAHTWDPKTQEYVQRVKVDGMTESGSNERQIVDAQGSPIFTKINPAYVEIERQAVVLDICDVEVRNTEWIYSPAVDMSKYRDLTLYAYNTTDQDVSIFPRITSEPGYFWNETTGLFEAQNSETITLPSNPDGEVFILNQSWQELIGKPIVTLQIVSQAITAPTSGSVIVKAIGVPH